MKKIISLVLALAMIMMVGAAFATDPQPESGEFTHGAFSQSVETTITASGLDSGDAVYYTQLVEFDPTVEGGWKLTTDGSSCGVSLAELLNGITAAEAAEIASHFTSGGTQMTTDGTSATASVPAGLYYLRAVATSDDTIYNPAFVSADYYAGGNIVDFSTTIGSSAVVKKSSVEFDKQVGHGSTHDYTYNDVKPGDYIPYKITTKIPAYGTAYDEAVFTVSDSFSTGLVLAIDDDHPFTVTYGDGTGTQAGVTDVYTSNAANNGSSFEIVFDEDYLLSASRGVTNVTITYYGKVTTNAPMNVNPLDNTASLTYSNKPGETSDKHDRTRHYTFSIDGNLLGQTGKITKELIKVGVDANGNVIEQSKETVHTEAVSPLAGANFTLAPVANTGAGFGTGTVATINSASDGTLTWNGLDAGIYSLVENTAPNGFVKDTTTYYIAIVPTYTGDILTSYKILWGTVADVDQMTEVTTFNMSNTGSGYEEVVTSSSADDAHAKVQNTQGYELPSTGGIGTTLFYVIGGLLVVAAAIVLVARRKAND